MEGGIGNFSIELCSTQFKDWQKQDIMWHVNNLHPIKIRWGNKLRSCSLIDKRTVTSECQCWWLFREQCFWWQPLLFHSAHVYTQTAPNLPDCQQQGCHHVRFSGVRTKDFTPPNKLGFKFKQAKVEGRDCKPNSTKVYKKEQLHLKEYRKGECMKWNNRASFRQY